MVAIDIITDVKQGEQYWRRFWPKRQIFDLWPVRACFHHQFKQAPYFIVAHDRGIFQGMLALSRIDESKCYGHFPGELWQGRTWLEQNRIIASVPYVAEALLDHIPGPEDIRYLSQPIVPMEGSWIHDDETGYMFYPAHYGYSVDTFMGCFSGKRRKNLRRELDCLRAQGVEYRYNRLSDIDLLFNLNLENFGEQSYFRDPRFLNAFENLAIWLHANDLLRLTTVIIGGQVAAVDMGAVFNSIYTIMAGAVHPEFPGIAKLINLHHIELSCRWKVSETDFLCGDFNWKERFHLSPRLLYNIRHRNSISQGNEAVEHQRVACAA